MRLFLAIELPEAVRAHLGAFVAGGGIEALVVERWGDDFPIKFTRTENLHVTLKFLGEVEDRVVEELRRSLEEPLPAPPANVRLSHAELFPPRGAIHILAAGLDGELDKIELMHRQVEGRCEALGFARERRAYRPHVTLGRARRPLPGTLRERLTRQIELGLPRAPFDVRSISLFESRLRPEGPLYTRLAEFALNGA
jgi:2'-5' RNA ligase